ncbi:MAG: hypothetical protein IJW75_01720 [Alphaproteobacteria bacterium]|nr:hypothetical protein [Alphaproteobacteria bacterium]
MLDKKCEYDKLKAQKNYNVKSLKKSIMLGYNLLLVLEIVLATVTLIGSVFYSIIQMFVWVKAAEIFKSFTYLPYLITKIESLFLIGMLAEAKFMPYAYIFLFVLTIIPFFLPSKCYQFSKYYSVKWLGWFNRWRTLFLLVAVYICAYFTGYAIKLREQYRLEHAKEYVIGNMTSEVYLEDDVNYITVTGGDGVICQVSGKTQKEGIRLNLIPITGSDNMQISVSELKVSCEGYEVGDTVRIFNSRIVGKR